VYLLANQSNLEILIEIEPTKNIIKNHYLIILNMIIHMPILKLWDKLINSTLLNLSDSKNLWPPDYYKTNLLEKEDGPNSFLTMEKVIWILNSMWTLSIKKFRKNLTMKKKKMKMDSLKSKMKINSILLLPKWVFLL